MLNGAELGRAITQAIQMKLKKGIISAKADVARHFGIRPPSLRDWETRGVVGKRHFPEFWNYFSDVVGPEYWGLSPSDIGAPLPSNVSAVHSPKPPAYTHPGKLTREEAKLLRGFRCAESAVRAAMIGLAESSISAFQSRTGTSD